MLEISTHTVFERQITLRSRMWNPWVDGNKRGFFGIEISDVTSLTAKTSNLKRNHAVSAKF